jgi:hypothetical protein
VYVFDDVGNQKSIGLPKDNPNAPSPEQLQKAGETVYLFKWLFPEETLQRKVGGGCKHKKFRDAFKK